MKKSALHRSGTRPVVCLCAAALLLALSPSVLRAGEGALAGLRSGFGTAAYALGNAYTATATDPTGLAYNPAGPAPTGRFSVTAGSAAHGAGSFAARSELDFGRPYAGASVRTDRAGTFSVLWRHFGVADIEERLTRDDAATSLFGYSEDWFALGWNRDLIANRFFFGLSANYARMGFDYGAGPSASALGGSIGVLYTGVKLLRLGAAVESKMTLNHEDDREDTSPGRARAGLAVGPLGRWLTLAADVEQIHGEPAKVHAGARLEHRPRQASTLESVYLGGGVADWPVEDRGSGLATGEQRRLTLGAGATVRLGQVAVQAGYGLASGRFGLDHVLSVSLAGTP